MFGWKPFTSSGWYSRSQITCPKNQFLVDSPGLSLCVKEIFNSTKQDDGREYQVLNEDTLKIFLGNDDWTGLAIYLFFMGELCDSWLNQTTSHLNSIVSVYTSHDFLTSKKITMPLMLIDCLTFTANMTNKENLGTSDSTNKLITKNLQQNCSHLIFPAIPWLFLIMLSSQLVKLVRRICWSLKIFLTTFSNRNPSGGRGDSHY
ncbi:hypothetical protein VP01_4378g2 [Puccinia sorghi]|uniref:Uncharacterized protein n=1 Tax=Puccinia sorghi TaxID=27349 RepID=A0A0L6UPR9_9BASI|nr:hypothetical protein VP01_4378g2 [Puccinia sorghi]